MSGPGGHVDGEYAVITANDDDGYASRVPFAARFVTVAGVTNDGDDWIVLPTGVKPGHTISGWSVAAHEIRTEAESDIEINSENCDGTKEAAIPATTLWTVTYINDTIGWILTAADELGAVVTAIVPD